MERLRGDELPSDVIVVHGHLDLTKPEDRGLLQACGEAVRNYHTPDKNYTN